MKNRFHKSIAFCLVMTMLAALFIGCSTVTAQQADNIDVQRAMSSYAYLLRTNPAVENKSEEILNDLTFGYEKDLAKFGYHYDYFTLLDLNQDGIPELIAVTVVNNRWVPVSVFRYSAAEGEPQLLTPPSDPEARVTFEQMSTAGGTYSLYICKENHIHSCWSGDTPIGFLEENHAYVLSSEGLADVDCTISSLSEDPSDILVNIPDILQLNDDNTRKLALSIN